MQEAVPVGVGAMAAILGADLKTVEEVCLEVAGTDHICSPANINSPSQIVIAGNVEAVDRACEVLKERGAKKSRCPHCVANRRARAELIELT
jgi:[acyl-carrier-protein] S-malonyltransferase